jgi:hypothetical protein
VCRNLNLRIFWKVTLQLWVFTLNCRCQYNKSLKIIWLVIVIFGMSLFFFLFLQFIVGRANAWLLPPLCCTHGWTCSQLWLKMWYGTIWNAVCIQGDLWLNCLVPEVIPTWKCHANTVQCRIFIMITHFNSFFNICDQFQEKQRYITMIVDSSVYDNFISAINHEHWNYCTKYITYKTHTR